MSKKGTLRFPIGFAFLAIATMACFACYAADDVSVTTTSPGSTTEEHHVSVSTQSSDTAPTKERVTVTKDADGTTHIRHEAISDVPDADTSIIVKTAPPEPKHEEVRIETKPAENAVWVPGYWRWNPTRDTYEWVSGTWRRAIPGMAWHPGHWVKFSNGYEWVPGYWGEGSSSSGSSTTVSRETTSDGSVTTTKTTMIKEAPPALREETRPASPGADYAWIPGHWDYRDGKYVWTSGRWERPISQGMTWIPGRWIHTADGGYTYISGHWDYPLRRALT